MSNNKIIVFSANTVFEANNLAVNTTLQFSTTLPDTILDVAMSQTFVTAFFVLHTSSLLNYFISVVSNGFVTVTFNTTVSVALGFGKMVSKGNKIVAMAENNLIVLTYNGTNFNSSSISTLVSAKSSDSIDIH